MSEQFFPNMADIIPEAVEGEYRITHYTISEQEARMAQLRGAMHGSRFEASVKPGKIARLHRGHQLVMTDSGGEKYSNTGFYYDAHGDVLIGGLGIGMVVAAIARKPEVTSITVVEISREVIQLVTLPLVKYLGSDGDKLKIVHGDILTYKPVEKFNVIYFDIWDEVSCENYESMKKLHRRFWRYLNPDDPEKKMDSWQRDWVRDMSRKDRRFAGY